MNPRRNSHRKSSYTLEVPTSGLLTIAAVLVLTWLALQVVDRAGSVLALVAGAAAAAVIFGPAVQRMAQHVPRALALVCVTLGGMALIIAMAATIGWDLNRQSSALADGIETAIERLPPDSNATELAGRINLVERSHDLLDDLAALAVLGDTNLTAAASQLSKLIVIAVMAAFMVSEGRSLRQSALKAIPDRRTRDNLETMINTGIARAGSFCRRTIAVSAGHGLAAGLVAVLLGLPGSISLGAWVTLASTMPILGGPLAWAPIVVVAFAIDAWFVAVLALAVAAIGADRYLRHRFASPALRVGPLLTLFGIGAGLYILGLAGGFVGLVVVSAVAGILASYRYLPVEDLNQLIDPSNKSAVSPQVIEDEEANSDEVDSNVEVPRHTLRVIVSPRTILTAAILVLAIFSLYRLGQAMESFVVWLAVGGFIAIGVDRPVSAIKSRWHLPRVGAIALVVGLFLGFLAVVGMVAGPSVTDSANQVAKEAPEAVASLEDLPLIGGVLAEHDVLERLEEEITRLPDRLSDSSLVERVAASAGDGLIGVFWLLSIVLAALFDGPRLVGTANRLVPKDSQQRAEELGRAAYTTLSKVAAASAFVAALNGIVVMLIALVLGVPLAPVLGVWSAAWNFIPQIGGFMGGLPLVLLATAQGPVVGIIALVVFVGYQSFENHVLEPAVGSRAANVPPLIILIGVLIGGSLFGFVGAILAGPTLGVGKVAFLQLRGKNSASDEREPAKL